MTHLYLLCCSSHDLTSCSSTSSKCNLYINKTVQFKKTLSPQKSMVNEHKQEYVLAMTKANSLTLSTLGWDASGAPASEPKPVTILRIPGGSPTSLHTCPNSKQVLRMNIIIIMNKIFIASDMEKQKSVNTIKHLQGRQFRGLKYCSTTSCQSRSYLPRSHQHRVIP